MFPTILINAIILCVLNGFFMVTGIILNSVVIISLWRSSQHRKKLCYFTIFVLSCFEGKLTRFLALQMIMPVALPLLFFFIRTQKFTFLSL